jgi:hypothetical protein
MVKAKVENGIVVNVIEVDPNKIPSWCANWPDITEGGIGWFWDGQVFTPPVLPEP